MVMGWMAVVVLNAVIAGCYVMISFLITPWAWCAPGS
jgi:hypothetical protein